jgi:hypothetical protein
MLELIAGVIVAFVAVALVLEPLFSARGAEPFAASPTDQIDFTDIEESESAKVQALLALKEIEFDRATGKLSDEDYTALKTKYSKVALAAIEAEEQEELDMAAEDVAEELIKRTATGGGRGFLLQLWPEARKEGGAGRIILRRVRQRASERRQVLRGVRNENRRARLSPS